ncbi:hypothetical protein DFP72DRAFT_861712 [Ephemerocybe angulata]|uniref:Uncharacterized protein n=1 Tax=Ephemerocybe angulata TaxID=980116 RepID=A0A8H6H746_9AGAR|nr:hypothetical protein DFP72DRAFT_861712 [Tulosesus angulatus]
MRDPSLNKGSTYLVDATKYKQHLVTFDPRIADEKSTCVNHDAVKAASIRGGKGNAASGTATCQCSRHDMTRPGGVGDLQKGERLVGRDYGSKLYVNIDFLVLSTLGFRIPERLVISYDIACQWSKKFRSWCAMYATNTIAKRPERPITFLVPKFHLAAHILDCQLEYSFNFTPGVGRTGGEAPERTYTKEMGPGSRFDTLDDNFGDHNWGKTTALASIYPKKVAEAVQKRASQMKVFGEFSKAIPPKCEEVDAANIRLQLAKEDKAAIAKGEKIMVHSDVSPSLLLYQGLDIEDQQRRLGVELAELGAHATHLNRAKVQERANNLQQRIDAWISIQHLYMPFLAAHRKTLEEAGGTEVPEPHKIELFLPSSVLHLTDIDIRLLRYEMRYRIAQAHTALRELRGHLLLRTHMIRSKRQYGHGQREGTKSHTLLDDMRRRVASSSAKYRYARQCLEKLSGPCASRIWEKELFPLADEDIKSITAEIEDDEWEDFVEGKIDRVGLGEGKKSLTWIWRNPGAVAAKTAVTTELNSEGDNLDVQVALRVEWCKARARAHRFQEECLLISEELRRIKAFWAWEISTWTARAEAMQKEIVEVPGAPRDAWLTTGCNSSAHAQQRFGAVGRTGRTPDPEAGKGGGFRHNSGGCPAIAEKTKSLPFQEHINSSKAGRALETFKVSRVILGTASRQCQPSIHAESGENDQKH